MDIYEIQREILATGQTGLETMPVHTTDGPVTSAEVKYNDEGFPYILLTNE
jgi:hypothetical protein